MSFSILFTRSSSTCSYFTFFLFIYSFFQKQFFTCINYHSNTITDAEPELINSITLNIRTVTDSKGGLKELSNLLAEFDDKRGGIVGQRAFLIACSRSRSNIHFICFTYHCYCCYFIVL